MNREVSILIPSYNSRHYLREALESIFAQTYPHWKVIVVDDGSTDNSLSQAEPYISNPRVRLIRSPENEGKSSALNKGLQEIDTPFFLEMDADDWLTPDALEVLMNEAKRVPSYVGLFTGNVIHVYEKTGVMEHIKTFPSQLMLNELGICTNDRYEIMSANYVPYPRFYRTNAVKSIGGWPVNVLREGRYVDDFRIFFRLIEDYRFHYVDHTLYYYRLHTTNKTSQKELIRESYEWNFRDALKRWGDKFEIVFEGEGFYLRPKG